MGFIARSATPWGDRRWMDYAMAWYARKFVATAQGESGRVETALELFQANEVTLERAAEIAGMNRWVFHETLKQRGIKIVVEVDTVEKLDLAVASIRKSRA